MPAMADRPLAEFAAPKSARLPAARTVLVISDHTALAMCESLRTDGYEVVLTNGNRGLQVALRNRPTIIIVEQSLERPSAPTLCKEMRRSGIRAHILLLGYAPGQAGYLLGPEVGADDLMQKPEHAADLRALLRARLRPLRHRVPAPRYFQFGQVEVDFEAAEAQRQGREVRLTRTELAILLRLISERPKAVSRSDLLSEIWGLDAFPTTRTVDTHILNLRRKLEPDPRRPKYIQTVHRVGYRFRA